MDLIQHPISLCKQQYQLPFNYYKQQYINIKVKDGIIGLVVREALGVPVEFSGKI